MIYERPDIQLLGALHAPGDQSISKPSDEPVGMNLRAKESKQHTHSNVRGGANRKQAALPKSASQRHWVFRDSRGKAIKGLVKEGVSQVLQNNCTLQTQPKKQRKELSGFPRSRSHRIYLRSTPPRPTHSTSNTPKVGKGNGVDITRWLVAPGVRSIYAEDGALLLDIKNGCCYSLNGVAARVLVTIEGSPAGISFDGIVDVLETHFDVTRDALERAARDCLADLQLADLVGEKVAGGEEPYMHPRLPSSATWRLRESRQDEDRAIIGKQPFVLGLETLESLVDRLFPQGVESNIERRAKKLKNFIDNALGAVNESLGHVCSQLQLSLSDRQARRLFKEAAGISMKDYARKRRLVFAAKQLQNPDEPIKAIATNAGYHTYDGFRKAFYDMFRLAPAEFRRFWQRRHANA